MTNKTLDVAALGSCYVDTNLENYPFKETGIPAEVELVGDRYEVTLGGSAVNFCLLLQTLGLKTAFVGMAGTDPNGNLLAELLEKQGIQAALIRREEVLTNIGFNMTNPEGEHIMLVAGTASAALQPELVVPELEKILPNAKMLYLGGYFKLKSLKRAFAQIADDARHHKTALILDHGRIPEGTPREVLETLKQLVPKATYYLPSRKEFCELWSVATIEDGLALLRHKAPSVVTIVKDSTNGAFYLENDHVRHIEAVKIDTIRNVTGAGDSFNAGVIAALTKGYPTGEAVAYGCQVAAAKIQGHVPSLLR